MHQGKVDDRERDRHRTTSEEAPDERVARGCAEDYKAACQATSTTVAPTGLVPKGTELKSMSGV